jgi:hypothetical protein
VVWRLDGRIQHLEPLLAVVAPYAETLRGERSGAVVVRQVTPTQHIMSASLVS